MFLGGIDRSGVDVYFVVTIVIYRKARNPFKNSISKALLVYCAELMRAGVVFELILAGRGVFLFLAGFAVLSLWEIPQNKRNSELKICLKNKSEA